MYEEVLGKVREMVVPKMERQGPIEAWIIHDTGFPKQGEALAGCSAPIFWSARQAGQLSGGGNAVLANHHASLPVAYRLYLPKEWAEDEERRRNAGVPDDVEFKTKPGLALEQLRWACEAGLPRGVVLMDAGYGAGTELRTSVAALDLGVLPNTSVWAPGEEPLPPKRWSDRGRPPKLMRRDAKHEPISDQGPRA